MMIAAVFPAYMRTSAQFDAYPPVEKGVYSDSDSSLVEPGIVLVSITNSCWMKVHCHIEQTDIEVLLSGLPDGNDYSPFQTKIHALLYMLLHSPRPMVIV